VAYWDARESERTVRELLGLFYAIVGVMLVFGWILAFVVLFNTLAVNLSERTVELATLRAAAAGSPRSPAWSPARTCCW
jgi:putative ABC transport system permease protein